MKFVGKMNTHKMADKFANNQSQSDEETKFLYGDLLLYWIKQLVVVVETLFLVVITVEMFSRGLILG